uniref:Proline-rich transmembrane protein 1 n=1 Tax=Amphimedon queenslandica TaxID=400682 RepID=A0A1X7SZ65_AMPQE
MPTQKKKLLEEPPPGYTPGPPVYYTQPQQPIPEASFPNDYLILSLFSIICCFWPVGVIALLKSIETRCYCQNGRLAEAQASSRKAKTFNTIFIGIGVTYHIFLAICRLQSSLSV